MEENIAIIGGGLAGSECALVLANAGIHVTLFEMKPEHFSEAHENTDLAELVCSNSFRSDAEDSAVGLLKEEMRLLGSAIMDAASATKVPAGKALAVDRKEFAANITKRIEQHPYITLKREEVSSLINTPQLSPFSKIVCAAGPLASSSLADSLKKLMGEEYLYFYDAIAPVVDGETVNMDTAFWGARYQPEDTDYLNCAMSKEEYLAFHNALIHGQKAKVHGEEEKHFEGCMPIEALAERGEMTLAFGPLKPVGFTDPRTGERPFAVLQLRTENLNKTMFNLVGCQTKLTYGEQKRIFRMIPGLEEAEFVRYGTMHRNTYVNAPQTLTDELCIKNTPHIHLAGQITGVEGYVESAACGLWVGLLLTAMLQNKEITSPPETTALGSLLYHLKTPVKNFQPSNVQFGLMPELSVRAKKAQRKELYATRAKKDFNCWLKSFKET